MKILVFCPHFAPDLHAATGEVMTRLVEQLAKRGHELTVVTSLPWYRGHEVAQDWRGRPWRVEQTEWGSVVRCWPFPTQKTNIKARAAGFAAQTCLLAALGLARRRHDVVFAMTPPLFLAEAAWLASIRMRAPFVLNTQDIFPDVAVELGAISNQRIISVLERYERAVYRRSDAITVLSDDQQRNVCQKLTTDGGDGRQVHLIKNFVDIERIQPVERDNWYRRELGLSEKTVVMYSGNVGYSQSFELMRIAAEASHGQPDLHFVINGEGAARPEVDRWAAALDNVSVVDFGPREQVPAILGAADIHLILLKSGLAASSTPSKVYGILAAGRPILASVDVESEVSRIVTEADCGVAVPPDDPKAFISGLEQMLLDGHELEQMGKRARSYAEGLQQPKDQALAYEKLFSSLIS